MKVTGFIQISALNLGQHLLDLGSGEGSSNKQTLPRLVWYKESMKFSPVAAILLLACSDAYGPTVPSDQPFSAAYRQQVTFSSGLRVTFVELLEESRCPMNVVCPWEGNARIRLDVIRASDAASVILNTHGSEAYPRQAVALGYRFSLVELSPYPATAGQANPALYVARLTVSPA